MYLKTHPLNSYISSRAANGVRTRDPQLGKLMLYQLSYCRINALQKYERIINEQTLEQKKKFSSLKKIFKKRFFSEKNRFLLLNIWKFQSLALSLY